MNPQDLFGVVVRTLGLLIALYGIWNLAAGIGVLSRAISSEHSPRNFIFTGVLFIVVGVLLISVADSFVAAAYAAGK